MLPFIHVFGREYAMYGILGFIGIVVGISFAVFYFSRFYDIKKEDVFYASLFVAIGAGVGAKLLYLITMIPYLVQNFSSINWKVALPALMQGGFVFYGGFFGGIFGGWIYAKMFKLSFKDLLLIIFPIVPIVHAIGRIGCFCAGCCYGKEYHGIGHVVFHNSPFAPAGVEVFPTQLVESFCNLVIFVIILITYKRFKGTYKTISLYCILYSIVRFVLEFYRGDAIRGSLLFFSTSQWISIGLFIFGVGLYLVSCRRTKIEE